MKLVSFVFQTSVVAVAFIATSGHGQDVVEQQQQNSRRAAVNRIIGYMPVNDISDLASIDLDLELMEELVLSRKLNHAKKLYAEGGHSASYATLVLVNPEGDGDYPAESKVWGYNDYGMQITGKTVEAVKWESNSRFLLESTDFVMSGNSTKTNHTTTNHTTSTTNHTTTNHTTTNHTATNASGTSSGANISGTSAPYYKGNVTIKVLYDIDTQYSPHCMVGALHVVSEGFLEFCFTKNNFIKIGVKNSARNQTKQYNYTYNIHMDNKNLRSLQSIAREASMFRGMKDFDLFSQYYGDYDYADRWVMAAADAGATSYKSGLGNADFSLLEGRLGRGEGILKGAVFLNLYMFIIAKLEYSVKACRAREQHISLKSLDEAVALYAGSLAAQSDEETGVFMYGLANSRALNFKTAGHLGDRDTGTAYVNVRIIDDFKHMQAIYKVSNLTQCEDAAARTEHIANMMKVPIVQSVLDYAYVRDRSDQSDEDTMEKAEGKGATYLAAVLPYIHKCSSKEAAVLYDQMRVGSDADKVNFLTVKAAFERTYDCLNITCADVGGIWDGTSYAKDASPCRLPSEKTSMNGGGIFGVLAAIFICAFLAVRYRKRSFWPRRSTKAVEDMSVGTIAAVSEIS